jgi:phospholipase C
MMSSAVFAGLSLLAASAEAAKIEHYVMLLMENRPIDHTFGCMGGEGIIDIDGIDGTRDLPMDPEDPESTTQVTCGSANYVCEHGPPNNMWALQANPDHNISFYPYGEFDDKYSYGNGAKDNAIKMFNSSQLPIKTAVAKHFAVFNNLHGSVPSMSTPNHLMSHTGTSCGLDDNLDWKTCGGNQTTFPQATIYDSLYESGVSFKMYSNSTTGSCPEAELDGVARHKENCATHTEFYKSAAAGTLPSFSYLEPPGEACDHPVRTVHAHAYTCAPQRTLASRLTHNVWLAWTVRGPCR